MSASSENQFILRPYASNWTWSHQATLDVSYDLDLCGENRGLLAAARDFVEMVIAEAQQVPLVPEPGDHRGADLRGPVAAVGYAGYSPYHGTEWVRK